MSPSTFFHCPFTDDIFSLTSSPVTWGCEGHFTCDGSFFTTFHAVRCPFVLFLVFLLLFCPLPLVHLCLHYFIDFPPLLNLTFSLANVTLAFWHDLCSFFSFNFYSIFSHIEWSNWFFIRQPISSNSAGERRKMHSVKSNLQLSRGRNAFFALLLSAFFSLALFTCRPVYFILDILKNSCNERHPAQKALGTTDTTLRVRRCLSLPLSLSARVAFEKF